MKRPYFQKINGANSDLELLDQFSNFAYSNEKWWYGTVTLGVSSNSIGNVYSVDSLTGTTTLEHTYTIPFTFWPHSLIRVMCKSWGSTIEVVFFLNGTTSRSNLSETYSNDSGATWTDRDIASWIASNDPTGSDIFKLTNYYTTYLEYDSGGPYGIAGIFRVNTGGGGAAVATITGLTIDPEGIYGGSVFESIYYFVAEDNSDGLLHRYSWDGAAGTITDDGSLGLSGPTTYNSKTQIYWIQGNIQILMDNQYLRTNFNNGSWQSYSVSGGTFTNGIIWGQDHLGNPIITHIIWGNAIWELMDNGVLKKIQVFEPRDYKKIYLTNKNENLTGIIQFQDRNGNEDLSKLTTVGNVSVIPVFAGHDNVIEIDDDDTSLHSIQYDFDAAQITDSVEYWITKDSIASSKRVEMQLRSGSTVLGYFHITTSNINYIGNAGNEVIGTISITEMTHIRIDYSCTTDTLSVWINGVNVLTDREFYLNRTGTTISNLYVWTWAAHINYKCYFDSLGIVSEGYTNGDNKKINAYVGYSDVAYSWDHKFIYLTNEEITGIVQWWENLDDWTTSNTSLSVVAILDDHKNLLKITSSASNASTYTTFTEITTSAFVEGWFYVPTATTSSTYVMLVDGGSLKIYFQFQPAGGGEMNVLTYTDVDGNTDSGVNIVYDKLYHFKITWIKSGAVDFLINGVSVESTKTMGAHDIDRFQAQLAGSGQDFYIDALGFSWDDYVAGSNNVFPDLTFQKPWFSTGDADTSIMQLSLKDWTSGTVKSLVVPEIYKAPQHTLIRRNKPFEDEWVKEYTDVGKLFYEGKVKDNNSDNRFMYIYLMKSWEDENKETKVNGYLEGYTHGELLEYVLDNFSKYRKYGPGTNADVNEFTPDQISGLDDDWANTDGTDCESSYVTKKAFLNGFLYNVLQQYDNRNGSVAKVEVSNISGKTIFSGKIATDTTSTKQVIIQFYEGATRIGFLYMSGTLIYWYDGASQSLQTIAADTIYHWALVFNATDDDVDIYLDGIFNSTQSLENNITTEIDKVIFTTNSSHVTYTGYHSNLYIGSSLVDALHTYSSISPLLTTTQNFPLKNQSIPGIYKLIAEETGYIVSERPDGMVYLDQYAPSGITIDMQESSENTITFVSLLQQRNEKFSFITFYGGFVNGVQITAEGFGEPNFGSYEDWFPEIQGKDPGDIYYDADGNPKSHRLDALVTTALANRNIVIKKVVMGKRGVGMINPGTSLTYNTNHYKISNETWNAWRRNTYNGITNDNRIEIADSLLSSTKSDPEDTPIDQANANIGVNSDNIVKNEQNIGYLAERVRSRDVLTAYIERNVRNLDENLWGFFTSLSLGDTLDSGTPINVTAGSHRILILINTGSDVSGTLTITGTTRDRTDTSLSTPADTEDIIIDSLSTDNSSTDAEGNTIHEGENLYISDKWFEGAIVISTTDLTLTDVDVYGILYHQFDSFKLITLKTFDFTGKVTNNLGWFYAYLYAITQVNSNKKYDVNNIVAHEIPSSLTVANKGYRRRKVIDQLLDGNAGEGIWAELFFGPTSSTYWDDISIYLTALLDDGTD